MDRKKLLLLGGGTLFLIFVIFGSLIYFGKFGLTKNARDNNINQDNVEYIKKYLTNNFDGNFPYPEGDLVYMDKDFRPIYVSSNQSIEDISNLYVVNGNICQTKIGQGDFDISRYDNRFSDQSKRCVSYAVARDRRSFQVGSVLNKFGGYVSYIDGNTQNDLFRNYLNFSKAQNNKKTLTYAPIQNDQILIRNIKGSADIKVSYNAADMYAQKINKDGKVFGLSDSQGDFKIEFDGKDFVYGIYYPNGSMQMIGPNKDNKASMIIKDFDYNNVSTSFTIKEFLGTLYNNIVSLSKDSYINLYDKSNGVWNIQGGEYVIYADEDMSLGYLTAGLLEYSNQKQKYIFENSNNLMSFDQQGNFVDTLDKYKDLFASAVRYYLSVRDSLGMMYDHKISEQGDINNEKLNSFDNKKHYKINYDNRDYDVSMLDVDMGKVYDMANQSGQNITEWISDLCASQSLGIVNFVNMAIDPGKNNIEIYNDMNNIMKDHIIFLADDNNEKRGMTYYDVGLKSFGKTSDIRNVKDKKGIVLICNSK